MLLCDFHLLVGDKRNAVAACILIYFVTELLTKTVPVSVEFVSRYEGVCLSDRDKNLLVVNLLY